MIRAVACSVTCVHPAALGSNENKGGAQQSNPFWGLALKEKNPGKTETQAAACFCTLDDRLFSSLECW